jgi:hypothetical protein
VRGRISVGHNFLFIVAFAGAGARQAEFDNRCNLKKRLRKNE